MLRDRHELDVGEAHLRHVVGQLRRELAVGQRPVRVLRLAPPGAQMNLVDRHRPVQLAGLRAPALPARRRRSRRSRRGSQTIAALPGGASKYVPYGSVFSRMAPRWSRISNL